MATLTITVKDSTATRVYEAMKWIYPKPLGSSLTDAQWAKQVMLKWITKTVRNYEQQVVNKSSRDIAEDPSLVS